MAKSFVLQALRILGLEDMLRLSQVMKVKQSAFKKAAGEDLIVWSDAPEKETKKHEENAEGKVLEFARPQKEEKEIPEPIQDPNQKEIPAPVNGETFYSSDFLLWQRELTKETSAPSKEAASKGYRKSTEMYVVKSTDVDGKEKIRFASTNGILVNKKQA